MISASRPYFSFNVSASMARYSTAPKVRMVISLPGRLTSALPKGIVVFRRYSPRGTVRPRHRCAGSRRPRGRYQPKRWPSALGVVGKRKATFRPGMWAVRAVQSWECWARALPTLTRRVTGNLMTLADMACHLAIWLNTSSPAQPEVAVHEFHQAACRPCIAHGAPTMALSLMGS